MPVSEEAPTCDDEFPMVLLSGACPTTVDWSELLWVVWELVVLEEREPMTSHERPFPCAEFAVETWGGAVIPVSEGLACS